jgi:hypothetical protein
MNLATEHRQWKSKRQPTPTNTRQQAGTINNQQQGYMTVNSQHSTETPDNIQLSPTDTPDNKTKQTRQQARVKTKMFTENRLTLFVFAKIILLQFPLLGTKLTPT